jgi:hypothetical protein
VYPRYSYPLVTAFSLASAVFFGGRRSFRQDGLACIGRLRPPLHVLGVENLPQGGPCLITFNHYYRLGFDAWWMALALAAVVPVDIHFLMTGELTFPGRWYSPLGRVGSRLLLQRVSKIYGFTIMPPMPPRLGDVEQRVRSVRAALAFTRRHPQAILGLAPEGGDQPGGLLNWPPGGSGRFVNLLAEQGFQILPLGVYEESGELCLRFGANYRLVIPPGLNPQEKDHHFARLIMSAIAAQLPIRLRGVFE